MCLEKSHDLKMTFFTPIFIKKQNIFPWWVEIWESLLPRVEPTTTEEFPYCRWKTLHILLSDEISKTLNICIHWLLNGEKLNWILQNCGLLASYTGLNQKITNALCVQGPLMIKLTTWWNTRIVHLPICHSQLWNLFHPRWIEGGGVRIFTVSKWERWFY